MKRLLFAVNPSDAIRESVTVKPVITKK